MRNRACIDVVPRTGACHSNGSGTSNEGSTHLRVATTTRHRGRGWLRRPFVTGTADGPAPPRNFASARFPWRSWSGSSAGGTMFPPRAPFFSRSPKAASVRLPAAGRARPRRFLPLCDPAGTRPDVKGRRFILRKRGDDHGPREPIRHRRPMTTEPPWTWVSCSKIGCTTSSIGRWTTHSSFVSSVGSRRMPRT